MLTRLKEFNFIRAAVCGVLVIIGIWILSSPSVWFVNLTGLWRIIPLFVYTLFGIGIIAGISFWYFRGGKLFDGGNAGAFEGFLLGIIYMFVFDAITLFNNLYWYGYHLIKTPLYLYQETYMITDPVGWIIVVGTPTVVGLVYSYLFPSRQY